MANFTLASTSTFPKFYIIQLISTHSFHYQYFSFTLLASSLNLTYPHRTHVTPWLPLQPPPPPPAPQPQPDLHIQQLHHSKLLQYPQHPPSACVSSSSPLSSLIPEYRHQLAQSYRSPEMSRSHTIAPHKFSLFLLLHLLHFLLPDVLFIPIILFVMYRCEDRTWLLN